VGVCKFSSYLQVNTLCFHYKYKPTVLFEEIIVFILRKVLNMCTVV
jgi:hypothetical protein